MPMIDGFTVCKILRNKDETAHIPIIHMCSVISPEQHQKSEEAGAELILTKPASIFDLVDTFHTFLEAYYPPENVSV